MQKRELGNSGLKVGPLALGGNVFGWNVDEQMSFELLDAFVAAGFNLIDTADTYSRWVPGNKGGESETIIGNWLKKSGKRKKVLIATKVGMEMGPHKKGLSKSYIIRAAEDSLRRLQTDHIDLYQAHADDATTPLEETLGAFAQLIGQGKVRAIGASNYTAGRLSEALETSSRMGCPPYQCLQTLYNLYDRADFEKDLEPLCREKRLGVLTYFSLASGFLTGKYLTREDLSRSTRGAMVEKYLDSRGLKILKALDIVAKELGTKPATVSLAWLISRRPVTAPISSATSLAQLHDLIAASRLQLDRSSIMLLDKASA